MRTTQIETGVLNRGGRSGQSPLDSFMKDRGLADPSTQIAEVIGKKSTYWRLSLGLFLGRLPLTYGYGRKNK